MSYLDLNNVNLYYEEQGRGPETLVFAHGLLCSGRLFDRQVAAFQERYRCIAFDFRGQGQSQVTRNGYDMDTLSEDAGLLIERLAAQPCHFVGLSMGGFVGMRLAIRRPELLKSLVLLGTAAGPEPATSRGRYRRLAWVARWLGIRLVVDRVLPVMFGGTFMSDSLRAALREEWKGRVTANDRVGIYRATMGVVDRAGIEDQLERMRLPTLIIVGAQDVATPPAQSERLHVRIRNSKLVVIPQAGHLCTVEEPEAVNAAIAAFLEDLP